MQLYHKLLIARQAGVFTENDLQAVLMGLTALAHAPSGTFPNEPLGLALGTIQDVRSAQVNRIKTGYTMLKLSKEVLPTLPAVDGTKPLLERMELVGLFDTVERGAVILGLGIVANTDAPKPKLEKFHAIAREALAAAPAAAPKNPA